MSAGMRVVITGREHSGKTRLLERYVTECRRREIPHLLIHGRVPATRDVVAQLAAECEYDRQRIEHSVLLIDDVDALTDDPRSPMGALYYAIYPVLEGLAAEYGKLNDLVDLAKVDIIATATERPWGRGMTGSGRFRVELPGRAAEVLRTVPITVLRDVPLPRHPER